MDSKTTVLFIQGGGDNGYEADQALVESLRQALGEDCEIAYPKLPTDDEAPDFGWPEQIGKQMAAIKGEFIIVAHSLGASMLLKYLSEHEVNVPVKKIFLIATPFWTGEEDWKQGLKLKADFAAGLSSEYQFYFYHAKDDEEVGFCDLSKYRKEMPSAIFREIETGGHLLEGNVRLVAEDVCQ